jgi:hypothetical protein
LWFNAFGMTDLVVALTLGALTGFQLIHVTPSGTPISALPLALIPTATVPMPFALHITAVSALVKAPRTPQPATAPLTAAAKQTKDPAHDLSRGIRRSSGSRPDGAARAGGQRARSG